MTEAGAALQDAGVAAVYLVHGPLAVAADYTDDFAQWVELALHRPGRARLPVRLFHWSGEPHHLGRADGAVRLIDELAGPNFDRDCRVLVWAHDDAANVLALALRLMAGAEAAERFFQAAAIYYRWPLLGCIDVPVWHRVRRLLDGPSLLDAVGLDVVTFGGTASYPWPGDPRCRVLHIRGPGDGEPAFNIVPLRSAWRARLADRRLRLLLDATAGESCSQSDDATVEIDYGHAPLGSAAESYTSRRWLLLHCEEIVRRFYAERSLKVA